MAHFLFFLLAIISVCAVLGMIFSKNQAHNALFIVLAFLSAVGGFVGIPIIQGANVFHDFLAPLLGGGHEAASSLNMTLTKIAHASSAAAESAGEAHHNVGVEIIMMVISLIIAFCGVGLAYYMYLKNPSYPKQLAEKFRRMYHLMANKWFVDEIYDTLFVNPIKKGSGILWTFFDAKVVDGMVNGAGWIVRWISSVIKRIQTGYVQNYALSILFGVGAIIVFLVLR